jgi:hypothetical protein
MSKTFHFEPNFEDDLRDLFGDYLEVSCLLELSTLNLEAGPAEAVETQALLNSADQRWVEFFRRHKIFPILK